MIRIVFLLAAALVQLLAPGAAAHEVRPAYLQFTETAPERFEAVWKQPVLAGRRLSLEPVLPDACATVTTAAPVRTDGALIERFTVDCGLRSGTLAVSGLSATLVDVVVRVEYLQGDALDRILRPSGASTSLDDPAPPAAGYFTLGVEHLLLGIDHILFVIGLTLLIRRPSTLVATVTAFTAAHSITLAASVLELVRLPQAPVEAVIALSILFLARELVVPESRRSALAATAPWLMAFAFGLLHGFGFAGALAEIGLPGDELGWALLAFNVGIEVGQLGVVAAVSALGAVVRRGWPARMPRLERGFAGAMGSVAAFWSIDRVMVLV
ncbi:MAG: HupE/UreJ family protein [Pseudomonadota bacterium]